MSAGIDVEITNVFAIPDFLFRFEPAELLKEWARQVFNPAESLNLAKLKSTLGKQAADDCFEFTPQVKLIIDADDNVSSISIWADSYDGLPVPEGHQGMQSEGSPFRKQTSTSVDAELDAAANFYRSQLASGKWGQWKENAADAQIEKQTAMLAFSGPNGSLDRATECQRQANGVSPSSRDTQAAKAAGLVPVFGKPQLFIANESGKEEVVTINQRNDKVVAGTS